MTPYKLTKEQHAFLREFIPGHHYREIVEAFNAKYDTDYMTLDRINHYCKNHKVYTGFDGQYKKGNRPLVAWKKGEHPGKKTEFKPGNPPHNMAPVGAIVKRTDGYLQKKIAYPNKWKLLHLIVWEEAHGPVPKGMCLAFRDGNRENCDLNNLRLIHRGSIAQLSKFSDTRGETRDVAITISELKFAIKNRR